MTHDTTPPKRIWVRWPQPSGTGLAFSCQSRPPELRTEYILASEVDALVAAALEPVMNLLMEPVATHTDSDWLGLRHDLLVQVTSAPAAAALGITSPPKPYGKDAHVELRKALENLPAYCGDGDPCGAFDQKVFIKRDAVLSALEIVT